MYPRVTEKTLIYCVQADGGKIITTVLEPTNKESEEQFVLYAAEIFAARQWQSS